jgi:hypothetical protein
VIGEESLKEVCCAMKRMVLGLTVSAMLLMTLLVGPALGDMGDPDAGNKGGEDEPGAPDCDWYGPYEERPYDPWWEYWCWWPGWGWEYVFWAYD